MKHAVLSFQAKLETEKKNYIGRVEAPVSHYTSGVFASGAHENVNNSQRYQMPAPVKF